MCNLMMDRWAELMHEDSRSYRNISQNDSGGMAIAPKSSTPSEGMFFRWPPVEG